jgi:hypothetical protein
MMVWVVEIVVPTGGELLRYGSQVRIVPRITCSGNGLSATFRFPSCHRSFPLNRYEGLGA